MTRRTCWECVESEPHSIATPFCKAFDCEVDPSFGADCAGFEGRHIAPPAPPFCRDCRGNHERAWSCDGEPMFKP